MNIMNYLGLPYDIDNKKGVNCWGLYALYMSNERGKGVKKHFLDSYDSESISNAFAIEIERGEHNHIEVNEPEDGVLIILNKAQGKRNLFHCGIYYKKKILHAKGVGKSGQVCYDNLTHYTDNNWSLRYFKYEDK